MLYNVIIKSGGGLTFFSLLLYMFENLKNLNTNYLNKGFKILGLK